MSSNKLSNYLVTDASWLPLH